MVETVDEGDIKMEEEIKQKKVLENRIRQRQTQKEERDRERERERKTDIQKERERDCLTNRITRYILSSTAHFCKHETSTAAGALNPEIDLRKPFRIVD